MRILREGMSGDDVEKWQYFLRGLRQASSVVIDGKFGSKTKSETILFQKERNLTYDGIVGPQTIATAILEGYGSDLFYDDISESGYKWPTPKPGLMSLLLSEKQRLYGNFSYVSAPTSNNPEAIRITDNWVSNNIVSIEIPQLAKLKVKTVQIHKLVAPKLKELFEAWEKENLLDLILTWDGSWVPRFVRGSRITLSNHSWGTAFDINAKWNALGTSPALVGKTGSVRKLVPIANECGWVWLGHSSRPDGMHFEIGKLI